MKKTLVLLTLIFLATTSVFAGNLQPSSAPGPTMKTLDEVEPRIPISDATTPGDLSSKFKITQPGSYYLTSNFTSNFKHGILIASSDVTIDLMGYRIYSSWTLAPIGTNFDFDGISISAEQSNIEIKNGSIISDTAASSFGTSKGFRYGIDGNISPFPNDIKINNVKIHNCRETAIFLPGDHINIEGCNVVGNASNLSASYVYVIRAGDSSSIVNNVVSGNAISTNAAVYAISALSNSRVLNNTITRNGKDSTSIRAVSVSSHSIISGNVITFNGENAVSQVRGISAGSRCRIIGNTISDNGYNGDLNTQGIYARESCLITDNVVCDNSINSGVLGYGIETSRSCFIDRNMITGNNGTNLYALTPKTIGTNHTE